VAVPAAGIGRDLVLKSSIFLWMNGRKVTYPKRGEKKVAPHFTEVNGDGPFYRPDEPRM
jgi:hypothetical protein